ncbi:hypothetical protein Tco_0753859 [Tanacetum coccineum]
METCQNCLDAAIDAYSQLFGKMFDSFTSLAGDTSTSTEDFRKKKGSIQENHGVLILGDRLMMLIKAMFKSGKALQGLLGCPWLVTCSLMVQKQETKALERKATKGIGMEEVKANDMVCSILGFSRKHHIWTTNRHPFKPSSDVETRVVSGALKKSRHYLSASALSESNGSPLKNNELELVVMVLHCMLLTRSSTISVAVALKSVHSQCMEDRIMPFGGGAGMCVELLSLNDIARLAQDIKTCFAVLNIAKVALKIVCVGFKYAIDELAID